MYPKNYMVHPASLLKDRTGKMRLLWEDGRRFLKEVLKRKCDMKTYWLLLILFVGGCTYTEEPSCNDIRLAYLSAHPERGSLGTISPPEWRYGALAYGMTPEEVLLFMGCFPREDLKKEATDSSGRDFYTLDMSGSFQVQKWAYRGEHPLVLHLWFKDGKLDDFTAFYR